MKKFILFAAVLFSAVSLVNAQTSSDETILNVRLHAIQTLVVNSAQKSINLDYTTTDHYNDGVKSLQEDHLKVYSTGAFGVQVKSSATSITRAEGTETIASSGLKVEATEGSTDPLTGATMTAVQLSETAASLITSTVGGVNRNFNITYSGLGANEYVNKYFSDEEPTVYTTTVTYTIAAQ